MEVITIESKAFAALVEKIDGIVAYVQASRQRELEQQGEEENNHRKADKWMQNGEVCEYLEISPRTLQRYRTNQILPFSICGKRYATAARTWSSSGNGGCGKHPPR